MTNNSSKSKLDYINKLTKMNIPCTLDNIFTSGMAMGIYLSENYKDKKIYLCTKSIFCQETENIANV